MQKIIMVSCVILLLSAFNCCAEGLGTLIELGKSQAEIQKQYAQETKAFEIVKREIGSGVIKKGMNKTAVLAKYGAPVVIVSDLDGKREDWIYKPAESSFFKGIRATLFFTAEGVLDEAKVEER
ncbi:MAG: hypothetical protein PHV48_06455 [Candidatus Omnitrophica bacterium]|nr:hypothetical protein [Candidatus Omnitrophota bacterium]